LNFLSGPFDTSFNDSVILFLTYTVSAHKLCPCLAHGQSPGTDVFAPLFCRKKICTIPVIETGIEVNRKSTAKRYLSGKIDYRKVALSQVWL